MHAWDQPAEELLSVGGKTGAQLMMPRLGEAIATANREFFARDFSDLRTNTLKALIAGKPPL